VSETKKPTTRARAAFIISIVGGIAIVLGGLLYTVMRRFGMTGETFRRTGRMVGGVGSVAARPAYGLMTGFWILGIVSGIIVLISAIMLNRRPAQVNIWGILTVIFSIVSFFGGSRGGFYVGTILGIIGGALALLSKPKVKSI
jgi:hypothetical protein